MHRAIETLGLLLALYVSPADEQDRKHVEELARQVQEVTGESVKLAYLDQGYTGLMRPKLRLSTASSWRL